MSRVINYVSDGVLKSALGGKTTVCKAWCGELVMISDGRIITDNLRNRAITGFEIPRAMLGLLRDSPTPTIQMGYRSYITIDVPHSLCILPDPLTVKVGFVHPEDHMEWMLRK